MPPEYCVAVTPEVLTAGALVEEVAETEPMPSAPENTTVENPSPPANPTDTAPETPSATRTSVPQNQQNLQLRREVQGFVSGIADAMSRFGIGL